MWDILLTGGICLGCVTVAAVLASPKSSNDPRCDDAHGDNFPVIPTDAQLLTRLYASEGTGCEVGFHSSSNTPGGR